MNVNFEYSKTLAGEGSILLLLSLVPYVGWVLGIVGVVLLLRSMKEFSNYYQDEQIYQRRIHRRQILHSRYCGGSSCYCSNHNWCLVRNRLFTADFVLTAGFGIGLIAFLAGLVVAFVFYVLAASHLKRTFNTLAQKSGEASFSTAGTLLWIGSILTIILVGLILIFIAWIFATIGFFTMKSRQYQQYNPQPNGYGYTPPPTQPEQAKSMATNQNNSEQPETAKKERNLMTEETEVEESSRWGKFLRKHWPAFAAFIAAAILAFVGAVYVFVWFTGNAQSTGLVPATLGTVDNGQHSEFYSACHLLGACSNRNPCCYRCNNRLAMVEKTAG